LAAIALIPSAPVLVPELAGAAAAEVADLRAACWPRPPDAGPLGRHRAGDDRVWNVRGRHVRRIRRRRPGGARTEAT
jgi:hypothetical protein